MSEQGGCMLKLSEAIRLGALLRPQAIGHLFKAGKSCAMGAAYEASGVTAEERYYFDAELQPLADAWNQLEPGACPVDACQRYKDFPLSLCAMVAHLNDHHQWTRERIAAWVESRESPQAVEEQITGSGRRRRDRGGARR